MGPTETQFESTSIPAKEKSELHFGVGKNTSNNLRMMDSWRRHDPQTLYPMSSIVDHWSVVEDVFSSTWSLLPYSAKPHESRNLAWLPNMPYIVVYHSLLYYRVPFATHVSIVVVDSRIYKVVVIEKSNWRTSMVLKTIHLLKTSKFYKFIVVEMTMISEKIHDCL